MRYFLLISFFLLCFWGCQKKDLPMNTSNDPVFYFRGFIGSDSFDITAGRNGVYMYTDFFKDTQNLTTLQGYFAPSTCSSCEPMLSFELKDVDTSNASILTNGVQGLFASGGVFNSYSLDSIATTMNIEQFTFTPDFQSGTHIWRFGDGATSTFATPDHTYSTGGIKTVTHIHNRNGNIDSISNQIDLDRTCNRPQFTFSLDTNTFVYSFTSNQAAANSVLWNFGNSKTSTSINDTCTYNSIGQYIVTFNATQGPACSSAVASFSKKIDYTGSGSSQNPNPNFNYTSTIQSITQYLPRVNTNAFIITWKNNGKTYKSYKNVKTIDQSNNPVFTATSFGLYENNEKGMKTLKVQGTLNTYLYNQSNPSDSILIRTDHLVVGAAYP